MVEYIKTAVQLRDKAQRMYIAAAKTAKVKPVDYNNVAVDIKNPTTAYPKVIIHSNSVMYRSASGHVRRSMVRQ